MILVSFVEPEPLDDGIPAAGGDFECVRVPLVGEIIELSPGDLDAVFSYTVRRIKWCRGEENSLRPVVEIGRGGP